MRNDYFLLALVYTAAWVGVLLNTGYVYWDDWGIVNHPNEIRDAFYVMVAAPQKGWMHNILQQLGNGVMVYRVIVFLAYLIIGWCFLWLLRRVRGVESGYPLLIAMLASVYPVNQARIALIDMPYGLTLATFSLATIAAVSAEEKGSWTLRIVALALFVFSFFTKSLLVFYLIPIALMLYFKHTELMTGGARRLPVNLLHWAVRHLDYLLLPVLFFILTNRYLVPNTLYAGYNTVQLTQLPDAILATARSMANLSWLPVVRWYGEAPVRHFAILITLVSASLLLVGFIVLRARQGRLRAGWVVTLILGALVLALAILPYQVVNKIPAYHDWLSRHQLLYPFGCAILLAAFFRIIFHPTWARGLIGITIALSVLVTNSDMLWYYADGVRQDGIVAGLRDQEDIRAAQSKVILFDDQAQHSNAMQRFYRYYEYSGFMRKAFGEASRFGERRSHLSDWDLEKIQRFTDWRHFNFGDFQADSLEVAGTAVLERGSYRPENIFQRANLLWTGFTDPAQLERLAREMVTIRWIPAQGD